MKSTFLALFAPALAGCVCVGGGYVGAGRRHLVPVDSKEVQMMTLAEEGPIFGANPWARPLARPRSPARRPPPPTPGRRAGREPGSGERRWRRRGLGSARLGLPCSCSSRRPPPRLPPPGGEASRGGRWGGGPPLRPARAAPAPELRRGRQCALGAACPARGAAAGCAPRAAAGSRGGAPRTLRGAPRPLRRPPDCGRGDRRAQSSSRRKLFNWMTLGWLDIVILDVFVY
jgi:hypothetical protein